MQRGLAKVSGLARYIDDLAFPAVIPAKAGVGTRIPAFAGMTVPMEIAVKQDDQILDVSWASTSHESHALL